MLSTVLRAPYTVLEPALFIRSLATEAISAGSDLPPPIPHKHPAPTTKTRTRLYPRPRPATPHRREALPSLPQSFGRNQMLPVSNSTREMLESIVSQFDAPIRYAFAYGSGVFEQDGYPTEGSSTDPPMLDFIFAVTHPAHFHSINMHQHPSHYTFHARLFGSSYVSKVQNINPGVWFNTLVPMGGVNIKYGVTTVDNLCSDLLNWRSLYLAGRMHKPIRIIKDDARVRLTQQVNLTSAVRTALLTLPQDFSETHLFERVAGLSYTGDPRMILPAENRGKVENIVRKQAPQFKELYHRLVVGLPGVHWPLHSSTIQQDTTPHARSAHLRKLPATLLTGIKDNYQRTSSLPSFEADESAYWVRLAGDEKLPAVINEELTKIIWYSATTQSLKGILSAGIRKSVRYSVGKVGKWWNGASRKDSEDASS